MAHYAKVDNGIVINTMVAEEDFFDTFVDTTPGTWIKTSYNTRGGVHYVPNSNTPSADQSKALSYNYAFVGGFYNYQSQAFHAPQPFSSWTLNESTWLWEAPTAYPDDGEIYRWNESTTSWDVVE
tara:strand:+ start:62 stop:436 length:375 start_codon:yes stop_codon:yes gene_type:complete